MKTARIGGAVVFVALFLVVVANAQYDAHKWTGFRPTSVSYIQYHYYTDGPAPYLRVGIQFRNTSDHDASFSYRVWVNGENEPTLGNDFVKANYVGGEEPVQVTPSNRNPQITSVDVTLKYPRQTSAGTSVK